MKTQNSCTGNIKPLKHGDDDGDGLNFTRTTRG